MKYIFRGVVVFIYDPETKQTEAPSNEIDGGDFNFCSFISEDYALMAKFFTQAYEHAIGQRKTKDLTNIEV